VIGQLIDPVSQKRDLNVRAPGVLIMQSKRRQINVFARWHRLGKGGKIGEKIGPASNIYASTLATAAEGGMAGSGCVTAMI
jgi:hypothetical protein